VIVTSGPGGQGDTTARLFAQKVTENLGQSFYIENMGGGGGNIAVYSACSADAACRLSREHRRA
jgi:tripartite-type tricarboxylate transporter receptor subunit TctC